MTAAVLFMVVRDWLVEFMAGEESGSSSATAESALFLSAHDVSHLQNMQEKDSPELDDNSRFVRSGLIRTTMRLTCCERRLHHGCNPKGYREHH
jgi:hypothetical protein